MSKEELKEGSIVMLTQKAAKQRTREMWRLEGSIVKKVDFRLQQKNGGKPVYTTYPRLLIDWGENKFYTEDPDDLMGI